MFAPDSRGLAAHRYSLAYTWADVNAPAARSRIDNCAQWGWGIGFVAGGSHLVVGVKDDGLWTFTPTGDRGHRFRPVDCDLHFVCSPVEPLVIAYEESTSGRKQRLYCCRIGDSGEWNPVWVHPENPGIGAHFSADGAGVWQVLPRRGAVRHDVRTGESVEFDPAPRYVPFVHPVFSHDHEFVANFCGRKIWIYRGTADDPVTTITNVTRLGFTGIAFHPSGRYLAAASNDGTVKFYDTATWAVAKAFAWNVGRVRSVAFSPDGTLAAAGSAGGKVVVWDVDV